MSNKMFYTAEEAAAKLGKSVEDLMAMAKRGEIQEFKQGDKVQFKVEQVNLLASADEKLGEFSLDLEESKGGSGIDLADSFVPSSSPKAPPSPPPSQGRPASLMDSSEETGISAFEASRFGQKATSESGASLEAAGSGSGLLDLTRESEDTQLGADLIAQTFDDDSSVEPIANASGLFEAAGAESGGNAVVGTVAPMAGMSAGMAMMPMVAEPYDGKWSGLAGGLMIGSAAAMILVGIFAATMAMGTPASLATSFAENLPIWGGGLLGAVLVSGGVGFFIGKATE
jgi:hypothetical protein